jgi:hypothetical protein
MKEKSFSIYFNFPLENSGKLICMEAVVDADQNYLNYNIHSFKNFDGIKKKESMPTVLPEISIKKLGEDAAGHWVHIDSEKPSTLSNIVGKAIEERNAFN